QIAVSALVLISFGVASEAETVGLERIWETVLGAVVAVGVAIVLWPPNPLAEARHLVARLRGWVDEDLRRTAELLVEPDAEASEELLEVARERSLQAVRDVFALDRGERALRWNPRRRHDVDAFAVERARLQGAARQYRHLRTLIRIVADVDASGVP